MGLAACELDLMLLLYTGVQRTACMKVASAMWEHNEMQQSFKPPGIELPVNSMVLRRGVEALDLGLRRCWKCASAM